jgi:DNA-directed RNA polymerase subunit RPC12/RpoP
MLSNVTCPNCKHKYWLQEGEMGSMQTCPNCQAEFVAGKSAAEARAGAPAPGAAPAGYAKTMMVGDSVSPITYKCPRCQAPLEAAQTEAGTKKNCPNCQQRHQVPGRAAPAAPPALNKTMLAGDEGAPAQPPIKYNCPKCHKALEAPAEQAGTKRNCPDCGQRLQIPAAPRNKTMLASDESAAPAGAAQAAYAGGARASAPAAAGTAPAPGGGWPAQVTPRNIALAVGALLLLWLVASWIKGPPQIHDANAEAQLQKELEKIRGEIELKKLEMSQQFKAQQDAERRHEERMAEAEQAKRDADRDYRARLQGIADDKVKAEMESQRRKELQRQQEEMEKLARKHQDDMDEAKRKLEASQRALEAAQQKQTVIQTQPTYYAPPVWSPRYYWWW